MKLFCAALVSVLCVGCASQEVRCEGTFEYAGRSIALTYSTTYRGDGAELVTCASSETETATETYSPGDVSADAQSGLCRTTYAGRLGGSRYFKVARTGSVVFVNGAEEVPGQIQCHPGSDR